MVPASAARVSLVVLAAFTALSAIGGATALLLPGSLGVPLSVLDGSVFTDFTVPALLLGVVIGGLQTAAVVTAARRSLGWLLWSTIAGFAMVVFIFVELAIMRGFSVLHGIYFATGLAQLALVLALLGVVPALVRPWSTTS
ncbi:hypothetical protein [Schumannella luteola]|jgi:hypothetical protein